MSPLPTWSSKQEPSAEIGVIVSPSSTTLQSPSMSASTPPSKLCMVSSVGVSVGMRTTRMLGSAYEPSTFSIVQVCVSSATLKIPAHSKGPSPWPWWWWACPPPILRTAIVKSSGCSASNSRTYSPSSRWKMEIIESAGQPAGLAMVSSASM